jgi:TolB-like protein
MLMLALLLAAGGSADSRALAVLELKNKLQGSGRDLVDAGFLTDQIRAGVLEAAPSLKVMTRDNLLVLLEASGKKLEDCEGECEIETGRRIGADLIVTGELLRFGEGLRVNFRLHETRSARLLAAAVASGTQADALEKDLHRAVAKLMSPLTGSRAAPTSRSLDWLNQRGSRLEAEARVSGGIFHFAGYQNGAVWEKPKTDAGSVDVSVGAGVRVGLLYLSPPDQDRLETSWTGFRLGSGVEIWQRRRPCLESQPCLATERTGWTAIDLPVYVGAQWSIGSFGPPEIWNGVTVGVDLVGMLIFQGSDAYQQANTDLRFGLGLHLDWTTFALDGKRFRPRLTFEFFPIPATATGPVTSREHTNAAALSLGLVWY